MLLNLPERNALVSILNHTMELPPSIEFTTLHNLHQLSRISFWVQNIFNRQFYNLTLYKIMCTIFPEARWVTTT